MNYKSIVHGITILYWLFPVIFFNMRLGKRRWRSSGHLAASFNFTLVISTSGIRFSFTNLPVAICLLHASTSSPFLLANVYDAGCINPLFYPFNTHEKYLSISSLGNCLAAYPYKNEYSQTAVAFVCSLASWLGDNAHYTLRCPTNSPLEFF